MVDKDFAWRLAQDLVRIDSSDPGAYEDEIERYIKGLIESQVAGLDCSVLDAVQIEELEVLPGRRNLMVTVPGLSDEPRLVYICHMDTVTLGDGWDADIPPLGATVRDDELYGRGACDMKGGLACAIAALIHALERVDQCSDGAGQATLHVACAAAVELVVAHGRPERRDVRIPPIAQGNGIHMADVDKSRLVAQAGHGDHKIAAPGKHLELLDLHCI